MTEVSELSQALQSLCKKAEENQADIVEIHQTLTTNNGKEKPSVHLAAPTDNQTEYPIRSNDDKSYEDNFASIENQLKTLESKFLDKTPSIANDLNNLKLKYCLNNEVEGMNIYQDKRMQVLKKKRSLKG